ncbi:hypothetical protein KIN20_002794 [Parelaphostrongylus tenuis]|uniref:Uncharacterized protein n=1 Tax=Parelaphostrongylus tenuis TaxID=148309 RepID=A0AAD5LWB8_PARTN|nr:hypothetical protein KIN20_002794 [Parelaphostrongylus tenuis]
MADPLICLRNSTIGIAVWNIIYSVIQMAVMGWQTKEVRDRQWEYEGRELPATGGIDAYQARFPGLYALYTETPERRRINALFVIVLVTLFLAFVHFFMSFSLLYGAVKYNKNFIWPWIFSAAPIIVMSTAYAVLWWSGDVFNEQLTMSVAEFVMSLAINGICVVIVIFFYWRLTGKLTSDKPAKTQHRPNILSTQYKEAPFLSTPYKRTALRCTPPPSNIPVWREEWPTIPDPPLQRKLRRRDRRSRSDPKITSIRRIGDDGSLDFFAPEPYDVQFPWKIEKLKREQKNEVRPHSAAEDIERLYYSKYPDELPGIPHGMRSSLRRERKGGRSPDRVTFSPAEPQMNYTTPQGSSKSSLV